MLALLVVAVILSGAGSLVALTWQAVNREVSVRETDLVGRALDRTANAIRRETASAAEWDDAYRAAEARDLAWMQRYFTAYFRNSFDHDLTVVLGRRGEFVLATRAGQPAPSEAALALAAAVRPHAAAVQRAELDKRTRPAQVREAESSAMSETTAVLDVGGDIYLVGVATILPSTRLLHGQTPAMTVASGRQVDRAFLAELERDLGIGRARLGAPARTPAIGSAPLDARAPPTSPRITWTPAQPGSAAVARAARPIAVVLLGVGVVCGLLLWRLRAMLRSQAAQDVALDRTLRDLRTARDEAQAASLAKSQFIANISHEIRTPLNGVLGMARVMRSEPMSATLQQRVEIIEQSGEALLAVLNDVLDLSKIEAGKLELECVEFDLTELVSGALAAFTAVAERQSLDFSLAVEDGAAGRYRSDPARIRQVLYNLISNALKFTKDGAVAVEVRRDQQILILEVRDTGIGMSEAVQARLFQSFEQADASTTRRFGGTGLGLAICRELVTRLDGEIEVVSAPDAGSTFRVHLPLERVGEERGAAAPARAADVEPRLATDRPIRVLAAEDNPVNQLVLRTLLLQFGIDHEIVENGAEAVEAWRTQAWDAILMDVQMPVMDGPTATRQIRQEERLTERLRTPIIALTANTMAHQVSAYLAGGMDACVAKPIDVGELLTALTTAVGAANADNGRDEANASP